MVGGGGETGFLATGCCWWEGVMDDGDDGDGGEMGDETLMCAEAVRL